MSFPSPIQQPTLASQLSSLASEVDLEKFYNHVWDIINSFGESKAIKLIENYDITILQSFKINILNKLITSRYYEIANLFINKNFYFDSYFLHLSSLYIWLDDNKEKEKKWVLQAEPISQALKYIIYKDDLDLFNFFIQNAPLSTSLKSAAVNLAIEYNRLELLKALLKTLNITLRADDLDGVKSEECAVVLVPHLPFDSKCVDYFVKQENFNVLKLYLENQNNVDTLVSSYALKKCKHLPTLQFLVSKCKKIEAHIIDLFVQRQNIEILSTIIKNFIPIEIQEKTIPLYFYDVLWKTASTFSLLLPYIGNPIPIKTALVFCVSLNYTKNVSNLLELSTDIGPDILCYATTDEMCLLFLNHDFSFNIDIIEHLIKIKANNYLKQLYSLKKYAFNKKNLNDAVIHQNFDIVCLLLSYIESDTITLALNSTEAILDCILKQTKKTDSDFLNNFEITDPVELNYNRLNLYLLYFSNINPTILSEGLKHLNDAEFLKCCKLLKQYNYQHLYSFVSLWPNMEEKPLTLAWLIDNIDDKICIKKINEPCEIKDLLLDHLNQDKIYFDPECFKNLFCKDNIPLDLFINIILKQAQNAIWKESFCKYASFFREFVKIMRSSNYIEWVYDPVLSLIEFFNKTNNTEVISLTLTFLNLTLNLENKFIWNLIKDHIIKDQFVFSDYLKLFNSHYFHLSIFDIYPYLKKICEKKQEDIESLSIHAFKLAYLFESLEETSKYIDQYLKKYPTISSPVKHASNFALPPTRLKNKSFWVSLIIQRNYPTKLFNILYLVPAIEKSILGPLPSRSEFLDTTSNSCDKKSIFKYYLKKIREIEPLEWTKGKLKRGEKRSVKWAYCQKYLSNDVEEFFKHKISILKRQTHQKNYEEEKAKLITKIETEKPFTELLAFIIKRRDLASYGVEELVSLSIKNIYLKIPDHLVSFAVNCAIGAISYKGFEKILNLLEQPKKQDFLPEVIVESELYPNYILKKIAFDNPFSLILGIPTLSCQNIGSYGENATIHGYKSAFGGFYYIENKNSESKNQIVAAAWAGITENGELVFDSVEFNPFYSSQMIADFFKAAAKSIIIQEPSICTVLVGNNGSTPEELKIEVDRKDISKIIGYEKLGYDSAFKRFILAKNPLTAKKFRLVVSSSVQTHVPNGKRIRDISLNPLDRIQFWKDHPKVFRCLRTHHKNPLLEEGYIHSDKRDYQGEFFLTDVALVKLKEHLVPKALFINFNDTDSKVLPLLRNGESISLSVLESFHAYCCYVENINNQIKIFIVDSEPTLHYQSRLLNLLQKFYPEAKIIFSSAKLQYDYSTCGVFMLKTLRYFLKEDHNIFQKIDHEEFLLHSSGYYLLKKEQTPAKLLKMAQCPIIYESASPYKIKLAEAILNSIVSEKKYLTLKQYLERYQFKAEKIYSTAAIRIKYRYFELLEKLL